MTVAFGALVQDGWDRPAETYKDYLAPIFVAEPGRSLRAMLTWYGFVKGIAMADEDDPPLSPAEQEREVFRLLGEMDPDTRLAFEKLMIWLAERPKESEPLSQERMGEMIEEIRLENIRRRLGGKVGEILQFKKPETKE